MKRIVSITISILVLLVSTVTTSAIGMGGINLSGRQYYWYGKFDLVPPTKTAYTEGEVLDLTGMEAYGMSGVTYADGTQEVLDRKALENIKVDVEGVPLTKGDQFVTVSGTYETEGYKGPITGYFCIHVTPASGEDPQSTEFPMMEPIDDLQWMGDGAYLVPPSKTDYTIGEPLDLSGMELYSTAVYGFQSGYLIEVRDPVSSIDKILVNNVNYTEGTPLKAEDTTVFVSGWGGVWKAYTTFDIHVSPATGDITGDGQVNAKDITLLRREITAGSITNQKVADVNGDGSVTVKDVTFLRRMIAEGSVE